MWICVERERKKEKKKKKNMIMKLEIPVTGAERFGGSVPFLSIRPEGRLSVPTDQLTLLGLIQVDTIL